MYVCVCIVDDNDDYNDYCGFIEHKIDENSVIMWCGVYCTTVGDAELLNRWIKMALSQQYKKISFVF